jgi:hypothetical protein
MEYHRLHNIDLYFGSNPDYYHARIMVCLASHFAPLFSLLETGKLKRAVILLSRANTGLQINDRDKVTEINEP